MLACHIEGAEGFENCGEIAAVEGVDIIQTGRGDLSNALGLHGQVFHPRVLEGEAKVVEAALTCAKHVGLHLWSTPEGVEYAMTMMERGVRVWTIDVHTFVLIRHFSEILQRLRGGEEVKAAATGLRPTRRED
jgi:2-keto-3-deoxy-L-rhamnonate aldolase RhmA